MHLAPAAPPSASQRSEASEERSLMLMWEVKAAKGRLDELLAFVLAAADPTAQVYRSAGPEPRVVVIDPSGQGISEVPNDLVSRPPHAWPFDPVPR